MKKRAIIPHDFSPYYPPGVSPCPMYVGVANQIYECLKYSEITLPYDDEIKKDIAINVAIYFEDKVSGIGLWNAFVELHMQKYLRALPFFDNFDNLDKNDVNDAEVELLIWLVVSRFFNDRFLNPLTIGAGLAELIMGILYDYDEVEVNDMLYDYIYNKEKANDYFKLKHILFWLRHSYLLISPVTDERFYDLYNTYEEKFGKSKGTYYAKTLFSTTTEIGPMAMPPHQWLSQMYYNNKMFDEAYTLSHLKYKKEDFFLITEVTAEFAILKDSDGEERKMTLTNLDILKTGTYVCTSLVQYGDNDWEINGVLFNADKEAYEKLCKKRKDLKYSYEHAYTLFMERSKGKRILFFKNQTQLKKWLNEITPEISTDEVLPHLPNDPLVGLISKKAGIIMAPSIVHAIKSKDNPFYRKCDAQTLQTETIKALLDNTTMHAEMRKYLLDNNMIQDGNLSHIHPYKQGNKIFNQNIDFIARNHLRHHYHDHDY